jgi:membrane-bound ClpP family serine protease
MSLLYLPETVELFPHALSAIVDETIAASAPGRVEFQSSYWFAEFYQEGYGAIEPGTVVQVVGRRGLTLLVLPLACEMRSLQKPELSQGNRKRRC